jgi:hypothetical protein
LATCPACQAELEKLQNLTSLLHTSPEAQGLLPADRFVAQVGLRLPRRPTKPTWQRVLETGWRLTPVGLIGSWAFVQTVFITAGIVLFVLQIDGLEVVGLQQTEHPATWLTTFLSLLSIEPGETAMTILHTLRTLGQGLILYLTATLGIVLLYWSWLASLWARRRHRELQNH